MADGDEQAVDVGEHDEVVLITVALTIAEAVAVIRHAETASDPAVRAAAATVRYLLAHHVRAPPTT